MSYFLHVILKCVSKRPLIKNVNENIWVKNMVNQKKNKNLEKILLPPYGITCLFKQSKKQKWFNALNETN